jgi:hypothetical protein
MYCRQRGHLYDGGENMKYYLTRSPTPFSFHMRAALTNNSKETQPAMKAGFADFDA